MAGKSAILSIRIVSDAKGAEKGFRKTGDQAGKWQRTMRRAALAAGAAVAGFAAKTAKEFEEVRRTISTATGASGDALDDLVDSVKNVASIVPASVTDIAESMGILQTATGASGDSLERLTQQTMNAARLLGEDATAASEAFGKAINQWGLDADAAAASMDYLFTLTQNYGISLNALTGQLNEYGSVMQNAGFSMEETADLFARLDQSGISVSRVMPGLNRAFRDWAAEQRNPQEALGETIDAMRNAETAQESLAIATDIFGAEGAQRMTTAVRNGSFALDDLGTGLAEAAGAVDAADEQNRTLAESFQLLQNNAMLAIEPLASEIWDTFGGTVERIAQFVADNAGAFAILAGVIAAIVGIIIGANAAMAVFRTAMILAAAATWIMNTALGAQAVAVIAATWPYIAIAAVIGLVIAIVINLYQENETFRNIVQTVGRVAVAVFDAIVGAIGTAVEWVSNLIDRSGGIGGVFQTAKNIGVAAFRALTSPIRAVIDLVSRLIGRITSIRFPSPPSWVSTLFGSRVAELVGVPPPGEVFSFLPDPELTASLAPELTAASTTTSSGGVDLASAGSGQVVNHYTHIEVTGALDKKAVADQIRDIIDGTDRNRGSRRAVGLSGARV